MSNAAPSELRITRVLVVPTAGADCLDDLASLRHTAMSLAERYATDSQNPEFCRIRERAEAVSVGLVLNDSQVVWGECVGFDQNQHLGQTQVFRAEDGIRTIRQVVAPQLLGRPLTGFRELLAGLDGLLESIEIVRPIPSSPTDAGPDSIRRVSRRDLFRSLVADARSEEESTPPVPTERLVVQRPLHAAVQYGVSQALLSAVSLARGLTMAEVLAHEYDLPEPNSTIPVQARSGSDRYDGVDRSILHRVSSFPHLVIDNVGEQFGNDGELLVQYLRWLRERIPQLAGADYQPSIYLNLNGVPGLVYENGMGKIMAFLMRLKLAVGPFKLYVEDPLILDSHDAQLEAMAKLRDYFRWRSVRVSLAAAAWVHRLDAIESFIAASAIDMVHVNMPDMGSLKHSVEAVLTCKEAGVQVLLGGSSTETDLSATVTCHVALATRPDIVLAKSGPGPDGGVGSMHNEMARTLAWIGSRQGA